MIEESTKMNLYEYKVLEVLKNKDFCWLYGRSNTITSIIIDFLHDNNMRDKKPNGAICSAVESLCKNKMVLVYDSEDFEQTTYKNYKVRISWKGLWALWLYEKVK
jgi:hypothetical protein